MILKQYYLGCLAHASYLIGDEASSTAIIVDPQRDIQQYLADAEKFGLQIRAVFLTHFHADFIAGHLELRYSCGATIYLGSRAETEYAFVKMRDGDTLDFPSLRLQILESGNGAGCDVRDHLAVRARQGQRVPLFVNQPTRGIDVDLHGQPEGLALLLSPLFRVLPELWAKARILAAKRE